MENQKLAKTIVDALIFALAAKLIDALFELI